MHVTDILTTNSVGEVNSVMICDGKIRCLKWMDKRVVTMLSTYHDADTIEKELRTRTESGVEAVKKPKW